jgi:hypothetical protein
MKWLYSLEMTTEEDRKMSDSYLTLLEAINQEIASSNERFVSFQLLKHTMKT